MASQMSEGLDAETDPAQTGRAESRVPEPSGTSCGVSRGNLLKASKIGKKFALFIAFESGRLWRCVPTAREQLGGSVSREISACLHL